MYRKHMTRAESENLKQMVKMNAHTGICLGDFYPQVDKIEIHYELRHRSFCDDSHKKRIWTLAPQDEAYFMLDCLNEECTSAGFDLRNTISSATHLHKSEIEGEMKCEGQEAPDHPEQSCLGTLKYTIKISYK